jgi:hypothetical protein
MQSTWVDGGVMKMMSYIEGMYDYVMTQATYVAIICFILGLGIGAVKLALGEGSVNKLLIKTFMSTVIYFIMMWFFPRFMNTAQMAASEFAYNAVMRGGFDVSIDSPSGTEDGFYEYLGKIGGDVWVMKETYGDNKQIIAKTLQFKITSESTGLLSINKILRVVIITFQALFGSVKVRGWDFIEKIADVLIVFGCSILYLAGFVMILMQYLGTLIDYTFIKTLGVVSIPTLMWDGTKHMYEALVRGMINITVKMAVVCITMYIACLVNLELLKELYLLSSGKYDVVQRIEFYVTAMVMTYLAKTVVDHAPQIADFLTSGQPKMSFGEMAQSMQSATAASRLAGGLAGGSMKIAGGAIAGFGSAVISGVNAGKGVYNAERNAGTGGGRALVSGLMAGGTAAMMGAARTVGDTVVNAGKSAAGGAKGAARDFMGSVSSVQPLSSEGAGRAIGGRRSSSGGKTNDIQGGMVSGSGAEKASVGNRGGASGGAQTNTGSQETGSVPTGAGTGQRSSEGAASGTVAAGLHSRSASERREARREQYMANRQADTVGTSGFVGALKNGFSVVRAQQEAKNQMTKGVFKPSNNLKEHWKKKEEESKGQ